MFFLFVKLYNNYMINILIVDDDESFISEIQNYYKDDEEITIKYIAHNGEEAIKYLNNDIDIIILDLVMPCKDGYGVLKYIKDNNINKKIILVSDSNIINMIELISIKIDYYFLKPINYSDLRSVIIDISKKEYHNSLLSKLTRLLSVLGMPSNIYGFHFIRYAIAYVYYKKDINLSISNIYSKVANKYMTTKDNVERCIRHAIDISWNRGDLDIIDDIFGSSVDINKSKPTNSEYIFAVSDRLKLEMIDY